MKISPSILSLARGLLFGLFFAFTICPIASGQTIAQQFAQPGVNEPDFQRHVVPMLGRLGCNGRACHGSFQGQGDFQLSLFGYDFAADHTALSDGRLDVDNPTDSLILTKPTDADNHEGGLRYEVDSWQYNLLKGWIESGAKNAAKPHKLIQLIVDPSRLRVAAGAAPVQLRVTAHWADGTVEEVTQLCRFESNNSAIAQVDKTGVVTTETFPGDTHVVVFYDSGVVPVPVLHPFLLDDSDVVAQFERPATPTRIDELVADKWEQLNLQPSPLSDDAMFLRRVSLDITGTLPTPDEIRNFIADNRSEKRQLKIDQLLETPAHFAWWTTFFCDITENNSQQLRNVSFDVKAVSQQWYTWIYKRLESNAPYDEIVAGIVMGTSRNEDESYHDYCQRMSGYFNDKSGDQAFAENETMPYYWMRREVQDPETRAISFAHAFLGLRIQCAQCHKHPFDQWSKEDFQQFSNFFSGVSFRNKYAKSDEDKKSETKLYQELGIDPTSKKNGNIRKLLAESLKSGKTIPFTGLQVHPPQPTKEQKKQAKKKKGRLAGPKMATLLGSEPIDLTQYDDIREPVMNWMRESENPYFAKSIVNRVWAQYFGVGIVDPVDDLNLANPPSNGPLLDYLASEFVNQGYDLKWLHREIANSRTYQLSWKTNSTNENDRTNFSRALPRRLPAEVIFDAVNSAASNSKSNDPFRESVAGRAIAQAGTGGYGNKNKNKNKNKGNVNSDFALDVFGRSDRANSCDCDRSDETSLIQTVYLQNDRDVNTLLTRPGSWVADLVGNPRDTQTLQQDQMRLKQIDKRMDQLTSSLDGNPKNDKQKRNFERAQKQLVDLQKKTRSLRQRVEAAQIRSEFDLKQFVEEAYLRTLSRFPTHEETESCVQFIEDDEDTFKGVTGVLWALINTKEFIVNH